MEAIKEFTTHLIQSREISELRKTKTETLKQQRKQYVDVLQDWLLKQDPSHVYLTNYGGHSVYIFTKTKSQQSPLNIDAILEAIEAIDETFLQTCYEKLLKKKKGKSISNSDLLNFTFEEALRNVRKGESVRSMEIKDKEPSGKGINVLDLPKEQKEWVSTIYSLKEEIAQVDQEFKNREKELKQRVSTVETSVHKFLEKKQDARQRLRVNVAGQQKEYVVQRREKKVRKPLSLKLIRPILAEISSENIALDTPSEVGVLSKLFDSVAKRRLQEKLILGIDNARIPQEPQYDLSMRMQKCVTKERTVDDL